MDTLKIGRLVGFHKLLDQPLATLRTLEVSVQYERFQVPTLHSTPNEFPALTSLTVRNVSAALAFRGPRITQLHITISTLCNRGVLAFINLVESCALLEELEIENETGLVDDLPLSPDHVIPLPHLRSFTQTLHCDLHSAGVLNNLWLPPSCSVLLRCVPVGIGKGYPPLSLPDLRNRSYLTNVKRLKVFYAEGCVGHKCSTTLDFINDSGTRFTVRTEFINYYTSLPEECTGGERINLPASMVEVLCIGGHKEVQLEKYQHLTTLILSESVVYQYLESLAGPEILDTLESLRTLVLFVEPLLLTSDLVRALLKVARKRAKAGLPLQTITFACPSMPLPGDLMVLEVLDVYVERVVLLLGDDALDWDHDKYFLNGV